MMYPNGKRHSIPWDDSPKNDASLVSDRLSKMTDLAWRCYVDLIQGAVEDASAGDRERVRLGWVNFRAILASLEAALLLELRQS